MSTAYSLLTQNNFTYTRFGLKILPNSGPISVFHETQVTMKATMPGISIQCSLAPVVANNWPAIWSFCDINSNITTICYDESIKDYSILITNPTYQPLFIDTLKIEHQTDAIWVEHFCSPDINLEYPIEDNYTCSNGQKSHGSITLKESSISINLKDIYNIEAHEIQIDDIHETNTTDTCSIGKKQIRNNALSNIVYVLFFMSESRFFF